MSNEVRLRNIEPDDLPIFYEQQLDADATRMAAFPARDRAAFDAHWATNILGNPAAVNQTILLDGQVAGNIGSWPQDGARLVGYWIGREHWGKGVATRALAAFIAGAVGGLKIGSPPLRAGRARGQRDDEKSPTNCSKSTKTRHCTTSCTL